MEELEKELDNVMARTSGRPLPNEKISSDDAFVFGISLSIFSVMTTLLTLESV